MYIDESGINNTESYAYGWCEKSQRYYDLKLGHKTERISIIAALSCGQILAPMTFVGYCQKSLVEKWVENFLVPELLPGQIVIGDNASFHQGVNLQKLIEGAGCQLLFLPPYSPDLNPIEKFWARLKHYVRKTIKEFDCLQDALNNALKFLS